jgi:hypothetical protein
MSTNTNGFGENDKMHALDFIKAEIAMQRSEARHAKTSLNTYASMRLRAKKTTEVIVTIDRTTKYLLSLLNELRKLPHETEWVEFKHNKENAGQTELYLKRLVTRPC